MREGGRQVVYLHVCIYTHFKGTLHTHYNNYESAFNIYYEKGINVGAVYCVYTTLVSITTTHFHSARLHVENIDEIPGSNPQLLLDLTCAGDGVGSTVYLHYQWVIQVPHCSCETANECGQAAGVVKCMRLRMYVYTVNVCCVCVS